MAGNFAMTDILYEDPDLKKPEHGVYDRRIANLSLPSGQSPTSNLSRKTILCGFCCLSILTLLALGLSIGGIIAWVKFTQPGGNMNAGAAATRGEQITTETVVALEPECPKSCQGPKGDPGVAGPPGEPAVGTGSTYVRWGKHTCPSNVELVYSGVAGGAHWSYNGSGANYLCLPDEPEYDRPIPGIQAGRARVFGAEYRINDFPALTSHNLHDVACAVCRVTQRGTMTMIPAKTTCPAGWIREYSGYLMSAQWNSNRSEFVCVDRNADLLAGSHSEESGSTLYPVEVRCLDPSPDAYGGELPCDKFPNGHELACVVCTK